MQRRRWWRGNMADFRLRRRDRGEPRGGKLLEHALLFRRRRNSIWISGSPLLVNNVIDSNYCGGDGGGLYMVNDSSPILVQNVIANNVALGAGGGAYWLLPNAIPGPSSRQQHDFRESRRRWKRDLSRGLCRRCGAHQQHRRRGFDHEPGRVRGFFPGVFRQRLLQCLRKPLLRQLSGCFRKLGKLQCRTALCRSFSGRLSTPPGLARDRRGIGRCGLRSADRSRGESQGGRRRWGRVSSDRSRSL